MINFYYIMSVVVSTLPTSDETAVNSKVVQNVLQLMNEDGVQLQLPAKRQSLIHVTQEYLKKHDINIHAQAKRNGFGQTSEIAVIAYKFVPVKGTNQRKVIYGATVCKAEKIIDKAKKAEFDKATTATEKEEKKDFYKKNKKGIYYYHPINFDRQSHINTAVNRLQLAGVKCKAWYNTFPTKEEQEKDFGGQLRKIMFKKGSRSKCVKKAHFIVKHTNKERMTLMPMPSKEELKDTFTTSQPDTSEEE